MTEYRLPVPVSKLRRDIERKASLKEEFDREDAIINLMLDEDKDSLKPYRYYARRWKWKESTTYKRWKGLLSEAAEWRKFTPNNTALHKVSKKEARSKQAVSEKQLNQLSLGEEVSAREAQSKQEVSSIEHTNTNIILKERKNTTYSKERKDSYPFTIRQAEVYFQSRLNNDSAAVQAGFQADLMAQDFWGHWHSRDFTDDDGTIISETTWKRRAATWYRYKERYGKAGRNGRKSNTRPNLRTYDGTNDPELAHFYR